MQKFWEFLKDNRVRIAAIILAIFGLYVLIVKEWQGTPSWLTCSFGQNVWNILVAISPELIGIAIGVLGIDLLVESRDNRQAKARLIRELGSEHNDIADSAAIELSARKWLQNGSVKDAELRRANLKRTRLLNADFSEANLRRAIFSGAKTYNAKFINADLKGATFQDAYIGDHEDKKEGADFTDADLFLADFSNADCYRSNFAKAKLQGCNLRGANLTGTTGWSSAIIEQTFYDKTTVWPPELQDKERRDTMGFVEVSEEDLFTTGPNVPSGFLSRKKNPNFNQS